MKFPRLKTVPSPLMCALLSGVLQIIIFPSLQISWLGFFCFIPLLFLVSFLPSRALFFYFFLSGFIFQLGNLYWILYVLQQYTKLGSILSTGILVLLCLLLSLFWGAFGIALGVLRSRLGMGIAMLAAPFVWITLEWLRNLSIHFPWCLLGYSQYTQLGIAQLASLTGIYGLSGLLMAFNAACTTAFILRKYIYLFLMFTVLLFVAYFGNRVISRPVAGDPITVGGIQGNIPQGAKLRYEFAEEINRKHLRMTKELIRARKPDLIVWSEYSTLFPFRKGDLWTEQILNLARQSGTPVLIGSDFFDHERVYNSAFLVNGKGEIDGRYDKMYLVSFGEYVPLRSVLFFAGKVVPEISDFSPGRNYRTFELQGKKLAVQICFDIIFPQLTRQFCLRDASLLVNITNDAWFGDTSAPRQHFAIAVMRAIENRRYMIRVANTGISGIIDPYGRILEATDVFVPATISGQVKWIGEETFYTRHGDLLVYFAFLVSVALLTVSARKQTRSCESSTC
ncbi:apolipoprotein N-acyltransferase [bacterium]|nr:apolipoprotein N-acyltransferase [bacterium]